jgi:hypothetical protein
MIIPNSQWVPIEISNVVAWYAGSRTAKMVLALQNVKKNLMCLAFSFFYPCTRPNYLETDNCWGISVILLVP